MMDDICKQCACSNVCEICGAYPVDECEFFKRDEPVLQSIIQLQRLEINRLNKLVCELNSNITDLILHGRIGERREE